MNLNSNRSGLPSLICDNLALLQCPACGGALEISHTNNHMTCSDCRDIFADDNGVPLLYRGNNWDDKPDVTDTVKDFYENNPFPNYEEIDSELTLKESARQGIFARLLDEQTSWNAKILEVGCGTGQLSNFLGMSRGRTVLGVDLCLGSLALANQFKIEHGMDHSAFLQMNLFRPAFKPESFDLVICSGVLHHTSDPKLGFKSVSKLVKPNGLIIIGLYNKYGRMSTDLRRLIFRASGDRFKYLDPRLRNKTIQEVRRHTWFMDQYKHPHESKHTYNTVLRWFEESGFEFVNSIPKATAFDSFTAEENLFDTNQQGRWLDHLIVQTGMLISGGSEGGLFLVIGRKI